MNSEFQELQRQVATGVSKPGECLLSQVEALEGQVKVLQERASELHDLGWNGALSAMQAKLKALEPAFGTDTLSSFYALFEGMKK